MQKVVKEIIRDAAKKFDLPEEVVSAIFESPYKCARAEIAKAKEGELSSFCNIRIKKLGLLYADPNKIKAIEYARRSRSRKSDEEHGHASSGSDS